MDMAETGDTFVAKTKASAQNPLQILTQLMLALQSQWRLAAVLIAISLAVAVITAKTLGRHTWEASGAMLYAPPPIPDAQKGLYSPPDLATLTPLAKSPDLLAQIASDFGLEVPTTLLDKVITVTAPRNTQSILVSVRWAEPDRATEMANQMMERFAQRIREIRKRKMESYAADAEAQIQECDRRRSRATETYHQFLQKHNLYDLVTQTEELQRTIDTLTVVRANAMQDETVCTAQQERMTRELEGIRKKEEDAAASESSFDAALETVADNRRRQDRLRELIDEERMRQQWLAELAVKRRELERLTPLRTANAIAPSEIEAVSRDIEVLTARLNDNNKIQKWREELEKIDTVVVPKGQAKSTLSPVVQQALFRKLELDLRLTGVQKQLAETERGLASARRRAGELKALTRQADGLTHEIAAFDAERVRLSDQLAFFSRLRDLQATELVVVTPARSGPYPVQSDRKLWLVAIAGCGGLLSLGIIVFRYLRRTYHGGRRIIARTKIEPVGEVKSQDAASLCLAVSRFRDWQPNHGAVILVVGDGTGISPIDWASQLATRFAARDERVLVIDSRLEKISNKFEPPPGLSDYLNYDFDQLSSLLVSHSAGVDLLPAGTRAGFELLATHRMRELLVNARKRYSLVLLIGPDPQCTDGFDLSNRLSDGILLVLSSSASPSIINQTQLLPATSNRCRALVVVE